MAIQFARIRYVSRSSGGNACRSAAYNSRGDIKSERTGERFYYAHRSGLLHHEIVLPEGADPKFSDAGILWNAAAAAEKRKDSQEAREILLALPTNPGLWLDQWKVMAAEFAREHFVSKGVAVQINIHAAEERSDDPDDRNVHAHILVTTRRIEGDRFASAKARDLDPEIRTLKNGRQAVTEAERWGVTWRDYQNRYFEREGLDIRVDDIGLIPQSHEGPIRLRTNPVDARREAELIKEANAVLARDPQAVLEVLTARRATFTELDIERLVKKHIADETVRAELRREVIAHTDVIALHQKTTGAFTGRYTTASVRDQEERVVASSRSIATKRKAVAVRHLEAVQQVRKLDAEQHAAFLKATGTDGLVLISGRAGTGKSYSLNAIREAHERSGARVIGLAPTNTAANDLRKLGFGEAVTVHLALYYLDKGMDQKMREWDRNTVIVVEEAGMLGAEVTERLFTHAAKAGARVVLVGDERQLSSVERGGLFTTLIHEHGSSVISNVRRQQQDWQREASTAFAEGEMAIGLRKYAERGYVHWSADIDESRARLLSDWDQNSRERPSVERFVYASTNKEVNELNHAIHEIRKKRGDIKKCVEVETVKGLIEIGEGDRLQFHGNDRRNGIFNSAAGTIAHIRGSMVDVLMDDKSRVQFDMAEFKEFGLGYSGTVYRGQGKTQAEVYALYDSSFAWNARTAYVGLTRHQAEINLYVSTDLAANELQLASQISRDTGQEASVTYATAAEVVDLQKVRCEMTNTPYIANMSDNARQRAAEAKPLPEINPADPDRAAKEAGAQEERRREILGAEHEDRQEAIAADEKSRIETLAKAEAARITAIETDRVDGLRKEQARLTEMQKTRPLGHREFTKAIEARVAECRQERPERPNTGADYVTTAQSRYTTVLATYYDPRDPYRTLAQASLAEAAQYQRDMLRQNNAIANEANHERRDMLMLKRDIDHNEHMAQVYDRLSGISRAIGGEAHSFEATEHSARADQFRDQAREARNEWAERAVETPAMYRAFDSRMRDQINLARQGATLDVPDGQQAEQSAEQSRQQQAMKRLNLPEYAAETHGYTLAWANESQTRATLTRENEELKVSKLPDGSWSYRNARTVQDRGDIARFEASRSKTTLEAAREKLKPVLERTEREQGKLYDPELERQRMERDGHDRGRGRSS